MKRFTRLFTLLTMLTLVFGVSNSVSVRAAGTWETVGPAEFSYAGTRGLSFDIDNGIPYVAYMEYNNSYKKTVKKFDGTDWITVGEEDVPAGFTSYLFSLDVDNQIPFVASYDLQYKPWVMKFNGTNWEFVGGEALSEDAVGALSPLVVDQGTPYLAYFEGDGQNTITVKKFDGTNWVNVGSSIANVPLDPLSLAVDNGAPYLAFAGANEGYKATVMKFDGTTWGTVGVAGFSLDKADNISLAADNGVPFVAYADGAFSNRLTVMKFDGTNWIAVGAPGFSTDLINNEMYLEIYNGLPFVAFKDLANSSKATVMKFNGTNWVTVGLPGFSNDSVFKMGFALNNGIPYVAYSGSYQNKASVMKFNSSTNSPPTDIALSNDHVPQKLPRGATIGTLTSIDADPNDPHAYTLTCAAPGPDDAFFKIGGGKNDSLQTNAVFDYNVKNSYDICVQTDDGSDGIYDKNFTIHVTTVVPSKMSFRSRGIEDGWVLEISETAGRGGTVNGDDGVLLLGDTELRQEYRSILSFNTVSLPDNAIVTKVTLRIKKQRIVGSDPYNDMGPLLVDVRFRRFASFATMEIADFRAMASMKKIGEIPKNYVGAWHQKVWYSDTFFSYINLKGRTQFRLYFANGDNDNATADYIAFYSGNRSVITDRPILMVEYYVP